MSDTENSDAAEAVSPPTADQKEAPAEEADTVEDSSGKTDNAEESTGDVKATLQLGDLEPGTHDAGDPFRGEKDLRVVYDIPVQVSAVLGRANMQVSHLLKLGRGAVVELDRKVGEAIDIYVNNRLVARGEVVVVDDRLGVTMTEIIKSDQS